MICETESLEISHNSNPNSAYTIESPLKSVPIEIPSTTGSTLQNGTKVLPKVRLVRTGTGPTIQGCRSFVSMISCSSKGKCKTRDKVLSHNCHRLWCKDCCGGAAKTQARTIEDRLEGLTNRFYDNGIPAGQAKHVVVSKSYALKESDRDDRAKVNDYIQDCIEVVRSNAKELRPDQDGNDIYSIKGFAGGAWTFHPERKKGQNRETQEWESVEDNNWNNQKYIRFKWVWGPHVHFVTYGFFKSSKEIFKGHCHNGKKQTKKEKRQSGFIFKIIPNEDGPRIIKETFAYLLTHSGIWVNGDGKQKGNAYGYFGAYSVTKGGSWFSGRWLEQHQLCEDEDCQLHLDKWDFNPVECPDSPMENGRPVMEIKNKRSIVEAPDPLLSWERDPHDIMHGWDSNRWVIWKKEYLYFLHGESKPKRVLDGPRPPSRWERD